MIHIGAVIPKIIEKARILRLERDRRVVRARLAELEKAIDGPFDLEASRRIDQVNEWVRSENEK
jgi:hypothetical protein